MKAVGVIICKIPFATRASGRLGLRSPVFPFNHLFIVLQMFEIDECLLRVEQIDTLTWEFCCTILFISWDKNWETFHLSCGDKLTTAPWRSFKIFYWKSFVCNYECPPSRTPSITFNKRFLFTGFGEKYIFHLRLSPWA